MFETLGRKACEMSERQASETEDIGVRALRRGSRHLGADPGGAMRAMSSRQPCAVRISTSMPVAATIAVQHTLWMATNLLARQFGVITELRIAVPAVTLHDRVALLGANGDLRQTLVGMAREIAGSDMTIVATPDYDDAPVSVELIAGDGAAATGMHPRIRILGAGWGAFVGEPALSVPIAALADPNPCGPYFAACLGSGEVFKHAVGVVPGKGGFIESSSLSLWDFTEYESWASMPAGTASKHVLLPSFYLVGAGAVGQAVVAALAAAQVRGHVTVIDNDVIDETNGNRCVLATEAHEGESKATIVAQVLSNAGMSALAFEGTWQDYALQLPHDEQKEALRALEQDYKYELVVSCVDKNSARHAIQNFWPRYVIGASTDGLAVQVAAYDMLSPYECLKCANPLEVGGATIEEVASQLRGMSIADRRLALEARGVDAAEVERYLNDPRCGGLGERELSKFSTTPAHHDWSVGFVSVAAGVLLGAQLIKLALAGPSAAFPEQEGNTLRFNFLRAGPRRSSHRRSEICSCAADGRLDWQSLWGPSTPSEPSWSS